MLWDDLKEKNMNYLLTRLFGTLSPVLQNGNCRNPTPIQFYRSSKKLLYLNLYNSGKLITAK